jgi:hypothetical protein
VTVLVAVTLLVTAATRLVLRRRRRVMVLLRLRVRFVVVLLRLRARLVVVLLRLRVRLVVVLLHGLVMLLRRRGVAMRLRLRLRLGLRLPLLVPLRARGVRVRTFCLRLMHRRPILRSEPTRFDLARRMAGRGLRRGPAGTHVLLGRAAESMVGARAVHGLRTSCADL